MENTNKILPENTLPANSSKNFKTLILGLFATALLILDWWLIKIALYTDKELVFWILPALASALVIAALTFFLLTNYHRLYTAAMVFVAMLGYVLIMPKDVYVLVGGLSFLLLVLFFEQRIRSEENSRQDFSIRRCLGAGISVMIYAFLLLIGLNVYYNTSADFKANPDRFYERLGQQASRSSKYISGENRSGIDFNQSLSQFLETEVEEEHPNFDTLPQGAQQQLLNEAQEQFFRQFNVSTSPERPLSEVMAQAAVEQIKRGASNFEPLFPLIFTLIIIALLRAFSFLFRWLTTLLTWALFRALLAAKFFRLVRVPVEVQKLEI